MIKKIRSLQWLVLIIAVVLSGLSYVSTVHAENPDTLKPTKQHMVNDYANVLSDKTKRVILDKNHEYSLSKTQPQVVVTTIKSTNGMSLADFTDDLMLRKDWKIGSKKYDNGVHIIFAENNGKNNVRINTGYGVESTLTDIKAHEILVQNQKLLKSKNTDDVNKGLVNVFIAVTETIGDGKGQQKKSNTSVSGVIFVVIIVLSGLGLLFILKQKGLIVFNGDYPDSGFDHTSDFSGFTSFNGNSFDTFDSSDSFGGFDGSDSFGGGDSGGGGSDI